MSQLGKNHTSPSVADGDGVRIIRAQSPRSSWWLALLLLALVLAAVGVAVLLYPMQGTPTLSNTTEPARSQGDVTTAPAAVDVRLERADENTTMRPQRMPPKYPAPAQSNPDNLPSGDANDIASYISPSDAEPTMTEVIQALRDSGDHGGIAAFNPPGTSPPLLGLAVPDDFVLPQGYVRHHQVTDDGQPIEPILMFSPDYVFRDAGGQPIPIPEDRVVPPEMAPPGLEIREITIPPPPE